MNWMIDEDRVLSIAKALKLLYHFNYNKESECQLNRRR